MSAATTWLPDGQGLPPEAAAAVAEHNATVHLRLHDRDNPQRYPRSGCGRRSLGGWWSGAPAEVTCNACLELVHA